MISKGLVQRAGSRGGATGDADRLDWIAATASAAAPPRGSVGLPSAAVFARKKMKKRYTMETAQMTAVLKMYVADERSSMKNCFKR